MVDVVLDLTPTNTISRRHAEITRTPGRGEDGAFVIRDLVRTLMLDWNSACSRSNDTINVSTITHSNFGLIRLYGPPFRDSQVLVSGKKLIGVSSIPRTVTFNYRQRREIPSLDVLR